MRVTLNELAETVIGDDDYGVNENRPASKLLVRIMGNLTDVLLTKHAFLDIGTLTYVKHLQQKTGSRIIFPITSSLLDTHIPTSRRDASMERIEGREFVDDEPRDAYATVFVTELALIESGFDLVQHVILSLGPSCFVVIGIDTMQPCGTCPTEEPQPAQLTGALQGAKNIELLPCSLFYPGPHLATEQFRMRSGSKLQFNEIPALMELHEFTARQMSRIITKTGADGFGPGSSFATLRIADAAVFETNVVMSGIMVLSLGVASTTELGTTSVTAEHWSPHDIDPITAYGEAHDLALVDPRLEL
jgi:hypothetical protein